jgi:leucyl-tRNA synthetase
LLSPAIPHFTSECIEDLGLMDDIKWPEVNKKFLNEDKIDYVIQINGKKRAILKENKGIDQESLLLKVKSNTLSKKYLKDKSISKIIFVKDRLINLLLND